MCSDFSHKIERSLIILSKMIVPKKYLVGIWEVVKMMVVGHFLYYDFCPSLISSVTAWSRQTLLLLVYYIYSYSTFAYSSPFFCPTHSVPQKVEHHQHSHDITLSIALLLTKRLGFRGIFLSPHFERQRALMKGFLREKEVHTVSMHSVMVKCVFEHFLLWSRYIYIFMK